MIVVEVVMPRVAVGPVGTAFDSTLKGNLITLLTYYEAIYRPSGTARGAGRRVNCEPNYDWRSFLNAMIRVAGMSTFELKAFR